MARKSQKSFKRIKNIDERLSEEQKTNLAKEIIKHLKIKFNILISA